MSEKSKALFGVVSGESALDCVYMFYSSDNSKSSSEIPSSLTAIDLFADPTKYGGIKRITGATPVQIDDGMGLLASTANGETYGEQFTDGVQVYAAAIVASGKTNVDDHIFHVAKLANPVSKAANAEIMLNVKVSVK